MTKDETRPSAEAAKVAKKASTSGFACMECGHKFKTLRAAERASFGPDGCPKCGGSDVDLCGKETGK